MSMARRPSPFGELLSLRQAMDRLFEDSYVRSRGVPYGNVETLALPLDIYSSSEAIVVEAALPGVKPEDVEITVMGNTLTISGTSYDQRTTEEPEFMYQELRRGTFARTVALPSNLDTHASTATFEHGMLRLSIPKAPEAKPRQIRITPTHDSSATEGGYPASGESIGNDSWAAGTAETIGAETDAAGGSEQAGEAAWEPDAAAADAWTDPAAAQGDSWSQQGATSGTWEETGQATDNWGQGAAEPAAAWGEQAAGTETWGATDGEAETGATAEGTTWTPDPEPQPSDVRAQRGGDQARG